MSPETMAIETPDENPQARKIDIEALRLSQDFTAFDSGKPIVDKILVGKPHRTEYFRVNPDATMRLAAGLLEMKEDRAHYLTHPNVAAQMPEGLLKPMMLFCAVTSGNVPLVIPATMPDATGRLHDWGRSLHRAIDLAQKHWVRIQADMRLGGYQIFQAVGENLPPPVFPELTLPEIINIAFRDAYIDSIDHPVIRRIKGEIL
jgi:hypothetical protein